MTRRAVVLGLGDTGFSCVGHLLSRGYDVVVCDSRPTPPLSSRLRESYPAVEIVTGPFSRDLLTSADLLAVSPGVSVKEPAIAAAAACGVPIVGDIELFAWACETPIVAITGSNGKSTVTTLVGHMLSAAGFRVEVAGNIGVPVLTLLGRAPPDVYVLELSSFQLETTVSLNAQAATVLNVSPDHMDRYEDIADYAYAKARIFTGVGRVVVNREDPWVTAMAREDREVVSFGLNRPRAHDFGIVEHEGANWLVQGRHRLMPTADVPIPGSHNIANVLSAFALATALCCEFDPMIEAVRGFTGLAHRTQVLGRYGDVAWIDDSKGTNVGATAAALAGLPGPVVLIAGGEGKGADFSPLAAIAETKARAVVLIGKDAPRIRAVLEGRCPLVEAGSMEEAVVAARALARPGDQVLLSPACASFDMFRNYAHRGDVFAEAVRRLVSGTEGSP